MSAWTHAVCEACWSGTSAPDDTPTTSNDPQQEYCCYCNVPTDAGIYVQGDPQMFPCRGQGPSKVHWK